MNSLASHYDGDRPAISFELFPPKSDSGREALYANVRRLMDHGPAYFTCTYGAGGSTQGMTLEVLKEVKRMTDLPVASHLTCVGLTRQQLQQYLADASAAGMDYIVALRGDPPKGETQFSVTQGGLSYANELVELIRGGTHNFGIAVAGYPETHQEAANSEIDITNLKRKVDAGADIIITQLFYDNTDFYRFRDTCIAAGIEIPIVPGILPVTNFDQAKRIAGMCKAAIPNSLSSAMMECDNADDQFAIGVEHARQQTIDLIENDVVGIHYYVLNKSDAAMQLLDGLGFHSQV